MTLLALRTASQAVQALLPAAVAFVWFRRTQDAGKAGAVWRGVLAALVLTPLAGRAFAALDSQSQLEAALAWIAVGIMGAAARSLWTTPGPGAPGRTLALLAIAGGVVLLVLRQSMEVAVVLQSVLFEVRSAPLTAQTLGGCAAGIAAVAVAAALLLRMPPPAHRRATAAFVTALVLQAVLYAVHESSESGWLPWSEPVHIATEPYGPDGRFGPLGTLLVLLAPLVVGLGTLLTTGSQPASKPRGRMASPRRAVLAGALLVTLAAAAAAVRWTGGAEPPAAADAAALAAADDAAVPAAAAGMLLARHTNIERGYGAVQLSPLNAPSDRHVLARLSCERLSFGAGQGLCLQSERGVFTRYRAVVFDHRFNAIRSFPLEGGPSRTRISPDGRVGAVTVFTTATHSYVSTESSTATLLVDMATGDVIGNLESFNTWRDGARFAAEDFNFWGVTFSGDSNVFYATLRTAGRTYLVRGDLALRKLTVLRENVECPSLSPDGRRLAFKKRVGPATDPWRFYVLDLDSMIERPLAAETRSIDDQIEWLDADHVLYGVPRPDSPAIRDTWVAPVDGGPASVFMAEAESAVVIR